MRKPPPVYDLELVLHPERDRMYVHFEHAAEHPFQSRPVGVPRVNAWWLAEAALASYWDPPEARPIFSAAGLESAYVSGLSTECYLIWQTDWVAVAFRGTESDQWADVLTNASVAQRSWDIGNVHSGFAGAIADIWPALEIALRPLGVTRSVWFCGHSLGGALAMLAAFRYPGASGVCTVGTPRVGDFTFAAAFDARLDGRTLRYVNDHDVITHVPPPFMLAWLYEHVADRRFIAPDGTISRGEPAIPHFFADLIGPPEALLQTVNGLSNGTLTLAPAFLLDHMPKAYAIWIWNDYDANG